MKRIYRPRFAWDWAVFGAISLVLCFAPMAWAIQQEAEFYVINAKPASVAVIDAASLKALGSIPLDPNPSYAVIGPRNRYLYILHNGILNPTGKVPEVPGEISVLDTNSRKVIKKVPIGWNPSKLSFSMDDRYLLCFSNGKAAKKHVKLEPASVTVIDTVTNNVEADLSLGRLGKQILFTHDASRIFVLTGGEKPKKKASVPPVKPGLTVFSLDSEVPLAAIDLPNEPAGMMLSGDEKWLYILDEGVPSKKKNKYRDGTVSVLDLASMKMVGQHDVGTVPQMRVDENSGTATILSMISLKDRRGRLYQIRRNQLARIGDVGKGSLWLRKMGPRPGVYVLGLEEMRFLSDDGVLDSAFVPLNSKKQEEGQGETASRLGGYPGETLYLPNQNKVLLTVLKADYRVGLVPTSKVAIVDLNDNHVEHVITTGRGGIKFAKTLGALAISAGLTYMSYSAAYSMAQSTGQSYFFYNVYAFRMDSPNLSLAASSDGRFIYALNTFSDDVTIINSEDGTVLDKIPVGRSCRRIQLTPGGKYVCAYASKKVTLIDTQSQKPIVHDLTNGHVNSVYVDDSKGRILALTTDSVLVFDAKNGDIEQTVGALDNPHLLVLPRVKAGL